MLTCRLIPKCAVDINVIKLKGIIVVVDWMKKVEVVLSGFSLVPESP